MPGLEAISRQYGGQGLSVVAVSIDDPAADETVRRFVSDYGLTFTVLQDTTGFIARDYKTVGVPATFLIDRKGKIQRRIGTAVDWRTEENQSAILSLLKIAK
jgi:peroxiredoxin